MANITINEISQNYTYNIGNNSYATVALPITSCWGPGFEDESVSGTADDEVLESIVWSRFPATQAGLESFVSTFRGPSTQYMLHQDYSYQIAMTLLTSGYDLLVTRVATGKAAQGEISFVSCESSRIEEEVPKGSTEPSVTPPELQPDGKSYKIVTISVEDSSTEGQETKVTTTDIYTLIESPLTIKAKYLGSFGNNLVVNMRKRYRINSVSGTRYPYWNIVTYVQTSAGVRTAVENINFVFNVDYSTDQILHIDEIESKFLDFGDYHEIEDDAVVESAGILITLNSELVDSDTSYNTVTDVYEILLKNGSDLPYKADENGDPVPPLKDAVRLARDRYCLAYHNEKYDPVKYENSFSFGYLSGVDARYPANSGSAELSVQIGLVPLADDPSTLTVARQNAIWFREWMFTAAYTVLGTLSDKLAYNPNRIIVPGWDDQDYRYLLNDNSIVVDMTEISPLHMRLMDLACLSRCATAYIDIPRSISREYIYNESLGEYAGYAQRLARHIPVSFIVSGSIYSSHSALFAPWGKYAYVGGTRQSLASPSFLALMIDRAMIKNQASQYEWELPTVRKHNLKIGKMDYTISKKYLDKWQSLEGVGINCITKIPDLGLSIWGNSTLYEVPPATYQALANLSTRKLVNAIEDLSYRCGISITFQYNNDQAYNAFYAGMTPLLDTMRNVGAITDYYLRMAEDVNGLDNVNANSVIGKIYLVIDGVINDINIDLIALPPATDLDQYRA